MQSRAPSEAAVHQSVAGRRLQALCRPHPQNGRPPPGKPGDGFAQLPMKNNPKVHVGVKKMTGLNGRNLLF
ncbi:hypothetical protein LH67_20090 [Xenorhabdus nematophila]|nr:hypothetical protein LH67_20090 [Xenorhabdus nematophila]